MLALVTADWTPLADVLLTFASHNKGVIKYLLELP